MYTAENVKTMLESVYEKIKFDRENMVLKINGLENELQEKKREIIALNNNGMVVTGYSMLCTVVAVLGWIMYFRS